MDDELRERIDEIRSLNYEKADIPEECDLSKGDSNHIYDIEIYIYREPGMRTSKQFVGSNNENPLVQKLSIMTALTSFMQTLQDKEILTGDELKEMVEMSIKGHNGEYE